MWRFLYAVLFGLALSCTAMAENYEGGADPYSMFQESIKHPPKRVRKTIRMDQATRQAHYDQQDSNERIAWIIGGSVVAGFIFYGLLTRKAK